MFLGTDDKVDQEVDNSTLSMLEQEYKLAQKEGINRQVDHQLPCVQALEKAYKSSSAGMAEELIMRPERALLHTSVEKQMEQIR